MPNRGWAQLLSVAVGLLAGAILVTASKDRVLPEPPRTLGPLYDRLALVAGSGDEGTADGPFAEARFQEPAGITVSSNGKLLVVADRGGHRLRGVKLDEANRVVTLAGTGQPGSEDGALSSASFDRPTHVQFIGSGQLVVWDAGSGLLRLVDLERGAVRTLRAPGATPFENVWGLAATERDAFLSQPERGRLVSVDIASGLARVLIEGDRRVPHPAALAFHDATLYLADRDETEVFRLAAPDKGSSDLAVAGAPGRLLAMASAGGVLYGLRAAADPPLIRALTGEPVPLISAWGEDLPWGSANGYFEVSGSPPVGLAADPRVERTLFVTSPTLRRVLSIRDLDQGARRNALAERRGEPDDDAYPKRKPAGVFRLLVVGDSHVFYGTDKELKALGGYPRALTFPKRLELTLNVRAALEGRPTAYEVLAKAHGSWAPLGVWPAYEVPSVAEAWNVDTILFMMPPVSSTLDAWLNRPPGENGGIPPADIDPEYLLLPAEAKLEKSPAAALFRACQKRGLATASPDGHLEIGASLGRLASEPELRREALELYGRPLELLRKRLAPRRLIFCFYPLGSREGLGEQRSFYRELCEKRGIELLDLVPAFDVVREAFYPLSELSGYDHFHAAGHAVLGYLVAHELVFRHLVPF